QKVVQAKFCRTKWISRFNDSRSPVSSMFSIHSPSPRSPASNSVPGSPQRSRKIINANLTSSPYKTSSGSLSSCSGSDKRANFRPPCGGFDDNGRLKQATLSNILPSDFRCDSPLTGKGSVTSSSNRRNGNSESWVHSYDSSSEFSDENYRSVSRIGQPPVRVRNISPRKLMQMKE